jgi:hypothetical protein
MVSAQTGFKHLTARGGITYEGAFNFEFGLEINRKYYNNFSLFFSGYSEPLNDGETAKNWTSGFYYEPNILASKNNLVHFRFGTSLGTNEEEFIIDLIAGIEYSVAISRNVQLTAYFKNNYMFNSSTEFRSALLIGIKHRL